MRQTFQHKSIAMTEVEFVNAVLIEGNVANGLTLEGFNHQLKLEEHAHFRLSVIAGQLFGYNQRTGVARIDHGQVKIITFKDPLARLIIVRIAVIVYIRTLLNPFCIVLCFISIVYSNAACVISHKLELDRISNVVAGRCSGLYKCIHIGMCSIGQPQQTVVRELGFSNRKRFGGTVRNPGFAHYIVICVPHLQRSAGKRIVAGILFIKLDSRLSIQVFNDITESISFARQLDMQRNAVKRLYRFVCSFLVLTDKVSIRTNRKTVTGCSILQVSRCIEVELRSVISVTDQAELSTFQAQIAGAIFQGKVTLAGLSIHHNAFSSPEHIGGDRNFSIACQNDIEHIILGNRNSIILVIGSNCGAGKNFTFLIADQNGCGAIFVQTVGIRKYPAIGKDLLVSIHPADDIERRGVGFAYFVRIVLIHVIQTSPCSLPVVLSSQRSCTNNLSVFAAIQFDVKAVGQMNKLRSIPLFFNRGNVCAGIFRYILRQQVERDTAVRCIATTFHVIQFHGVVTGSKIQLYSFGFPFERSVTIIGNFACRKVDRTRNCVMNASKIQYILTINKYNKVIITAETEFHIVIYGISVRANALNCIGMHIRTTVVRQPEIHGRTDAKPVVDSTIIIGQITRLGHVIGKIVKWQKTGISRRVAELVGDLINIEATLVLLINGSICFAGIAVGVCFRVVGIEIVTLTYILLAHFRLRTEKTVTKLCIVKTASCRIRIIIIVLITAIVGVANRASVPRAILEHQNVIVFIVAGRVQHRPNFGNNTVRIGGSTLYIKQFSIVKNMRCDKGTCICCRYDTGIQQRIVEIVILRVPISVEYVVVIHINGNGTAAVAYIIVLSSSNVVPAFQFPLIFIIPENDRISRAARIKLESVKVIVRRQGNSRLTIAANLYRKHHATHGCTSIKSKSLICIAGISSRIIRRRIVRIQNNIAFLRNRIVERRNFILRKSAIKNGKVINIATVVLAISPVRTANIENAVCSTVVAGKD